MCGSESMVCRSFLLIASIVSENQSERSPAESDQEEFLGIEKMMFKRVVWTVGD